MINNGYAESAVVIQKETGINVEKYEMADNIDLEIILTEFQQY